MANERALGVSFIYAAQTWRQLAAVLAEQEARALFGLTNVLVMFGGSKDGALNQQLSDLVGQTRVSRTNWQTGTMAAAPSPGKTLRSSGRKRSAGWRNDGPW
jgi:type IV secretion system protein VirD4